MGHQQKNLTPLIANFTDQLKYGYPWYMLASLWGTTIEKRQVLATSQLLWPMYGEEKEWSTGLASLSVLTHIMPICDNQIPTHRIVLSHCSCNFRGMNKYHRSKPEFNLVHYAEILKMNF